MDLSNLISSYYICQFKKKLNRKLFIFQAQVLKSGGKSGSCNLDKIAKFQLKSSLKLCLQGSSKRLT